MQQPEPADLAALIGTAIRIATAPLVARIAALEGQKALAPRDGRDGKDGTSVTVGDVAPLIASEVSRLVTEKMIPLMEMEVSQAIADLPRPKDGIDGKDGERGADAPAPDMDEIIARVLALMPQPERGEKGEPGRDGKSVDMDEIKARVDLHLVQAVSAIQVPKDGRDGRDGSSFKAGSGAPIFDAGEDDVYLDVTTGNVYQWR